MAKTAYEVVTERLIERLEAGTAPWRQPWVAGAEIGSHCNLTTRKPYRGINAIMTGLQGFPSPYWLSFKQASEIGAHVRKGERGTPVLWFSMFKKEEVQPNGEVKGHTIPVVKWSTVFNLSQIDGLSPRLLELTKPATEKPFEPIEECERVVRDMPDAPIIVEGREQRAFYMPACDAVNMPARGSFETPASFYATLFHELGHSTGHAKRLDRELSKVNLFGSHAYSKEELVAEMTSAFLCGHAGIDTVTLDNSAAYLAGWIRVLRGDSKLAVQAASAAQKAADFILGRKGESHE